MTHPLVTDGEPPGEWSEGIVGGGYISFCRSEGDGERHVVIDIGGEYDDEPETRPVEVWTATKADHQILQNRRHGGKVVGEATGMSAGAEIAMKYMEDDGDE